MLAAGGTTLTASRTTGAYMNESAWGLPYGDPGSQFQASGGGLGHVFSRPKYQDGVAGIGAYRPTRRCCRRFAARRDGRSHRHGAGGYTISGSGGTSASAPFWAGIVALADQRAGRPWAL